MAGDEIQTVQRAIKQQSFDKTRTGESFQMMRKYGLSPVKSHSLTVSVQVCMGSRPFSTCCTVSLSTHK